jgi:anti-sigma factor RsiW
MRRSEDTAGDRVRRHLDEKTVRRFRGRSLGPEELIAASRHLETCRECRSRVEPKSASDAVRSLRRELSHEEGVGPHLDFESAMMPYVEGSLPPAALEAADRHLEGCAVCRRELADLAGFRNAYEANPSSAPVVAARPRESAASRRTMMRWLAAAAAIAACIVAGLMISRRPAPPIVAGPSKPPKTRPASAPLVAALHDAKGIVGLDASGQLHGTAVSGRWAALVASALRNPDLRVPAAVTALLSSGRQARGTPSRQHVISVVEPVGVVVTTDRPRFRWRSTVSNSACHVAVYDSDLHPVATGTTRSDSWEIDRPLTPGRSYVWQVSTAIDGNDVVSPGPDEREARFSVLRADVATEVAAARRRGEGHLVLGVLLQSGGAVEEARREFQALADENPGSELARRLLASARTH